MFDNHKNFAQGTVATPPTPATSGTSLTLLSGQGDEFESNMPCTLVPPGANPTSDNAEVGYISGVSGDTLTVVRAQEGSSAMPIDEGWKIYGSITAKSLTDIEDSVDDAVSKSEDDTISAVKTFTETPGLPVAGLGIIPSANGTLWRIVVDDDGGLRTVAAAGEEEGFGEPAGLMLGILD